MDRRDCFRLLGVAGAGALLAAEGCSRAVGRAVKPRPTDALSEVAPLPPKGEVSRIARLLNRAGYGPAPGDVARVETIGAEAWVDAQLGAPTQDDTSPVSFLAAKVEGKSDDPDVTNGLGVRLRSIEVLNARSPYELRDYKEDEVLRQLQQAALLRAVYSEWQLRERMTAFWGDHFNIYSHKVINLGGGYATTHLSYYVPLDLHNVVRQNALGRFPELLKASAHSPAMLGYLDNQVNQKGIANENYAREVMELHTLGVDGGYTQKDVMEVARCLTGWTVESRFLRKRGTFFFDAAQHDDGEKVVLGQRLPAHGGEQDGIRVLDILAAHPSTARHIARKLVHHFRGDEDPTWVAKTAETYQKTNGDIQAMLRPLLLADDLPAAPPILKRPFDYLVSTLRATGADIDGGPGVQDHLAAMGQPLHQWPMPDGYPEKTSAWTGSLLARWKFAFALLSDNVAGATVAPAALTAASIDHLTEGLLARRADDPALAEMRHTLAALPQEKPADIAALILSSPAFQWR